MTFHNIRLQSNTDLQCARGAPRPDWRAWEGYYVRLMKRCCEDNWFDRPASNCPVASLPSTCAPHGRQFNTEPSFKGQPPQPQLVPGAAFSFSCGMRSNIKTLESTLLCSDSAIRRRRLTEEMSRSRGDNLGCGWGTLLGISVWTVEIALLPSTDYAAAYN